MEKKGREGERKREREREREREAAAPRAPHLNIKHTGGDKILAGAGDGAAASYFTAKMARAV